MNLLGRCKVVPAVVPTAGAAEEMTEAEIDCTGFDRICYVIGTGAAGTAATINFQVQDAVATGMSGAADVAGALLTEVEAATGANKVYAIDMKINPARLFHKPVGVVGTETFANWAFAILYEGSGTYPKTAATQAVIV